MFAFFFGLVTPLFDYLGGVQVSQTIIMFDSGVKEPVYHF